jgi:glycosyltransferase involved in cell wall biosynthesis
MVGTMESLRDHRLLVSAMRHVVRAKPRTGLLLVGDGTLRNEIGALVRRLELSDHVIFTGTLRRPEEVYPLLDVYAQASATEGISNSILEAMLCALPVVATDVGGNPEVVLHGQTGYLVPCGDESAMAQALLILLVDPHLRRRMGGEGFQYARTAFGLERLVTDTEDLYETLMCGANGQAEAGCAP